MVLYMILVDHSSIKIEDILNIYQHLMVKKCKTMFKVLNNTFVGLLTSIVSASNLTKCGSLSSEMQKTTHSS